MRYLAIGDIHGCFQALQTLEKVVAFHEDDVLITLGDYVDRGPNSFAVLDWLVAQKKKRKLVALRGNHEILMLRARQSKDLLSDWLTNGGDQTLASYSPLGDSGKLADVPDEHWNFLETHTKPWFEIETHFFVHANAYADWPLAEQPDMMLFWEPFGKPLPHMSGKTMVCGHTPQKNGIPKNLGHAVCIDTWARGQGWLTCLDVATGQYWQANQKGESRKGWLEQVEEGERLP